VTLHPTLSVALGLALLPVLALLLVVAGPLYLTLLLAQLVGRAAESCR
jgi:hypothetical protein